MRRPATLSPPTARAETTEWEATYPGTADQVRQVRAGLRRLLEGCPAADDVILLADELAANAIAYSDCGKAGGTFTVRVTHVPGDHVRAEVQDQGSTWSGDLATSARHPHGLYLMQTLATACGTRRDGAARVVWFRLDYQNYQASQHLTAVAGGIAGHDVSIELTRLGGIPVLTIEEPANGSSPTTISVDPDLTTPGVPLECTCIWTPPPGASPEAIADTIAAVLDAIRPLAAAQSPR